MSNEGGARPPIRANRELARGSVWMVAMRWAIRGIGLLSTVILARLLAPDDFGVLAMAMVSVAIIEVFSQSGVDLALLRAQSPTREHYDAAWTLEVIQGVVLAVLLFLSAPIAAGHFEDPRVTLVVQVLSLSALIGGFQNIGVVEFRRQLDFRKEFRFGVVRKFASFGVTIIAAVLMRSYWALVVGQVFGRVVQVMISYRMSDFRPRLSVARIGEIWGFSQWLILSRFARLVNRQFDRWLVGTIGGAPAMGYYWVAQDLATAPSDEVIVPMSRAAFPVYSRLQDQPDALADAFGRMFATVSLLSFAIGVGLGAVAENLVLVLLGEKWSPAIPLIPWLGWFGALYALTHTLDIFLVATGRQRMSALLTLGYAVVTVPVLLAVAQQGGVEGIAAGKAFTAVAMVTLLAALGARRPPLSLGLLWRCVWPSLVAAALMLAAVKGLQHWLPLDGRVFGLLRDSAAGAFVYVAVVLSIWAMRGRPAGIEADALTAIRRKLARR
ncbi:MAG: lipopolysaccharide biosynthesis protein [Lysobacterales bacterium]|nr:MAG: lipopolysaccharide biosynthesis protein [Xanthomonadales bacterium]